MSKRAYFYGGTIVLEDVRRQVAMGAGHITFGDPDFFNGPGHSIAILRELRGGVSGERTQKSRLALMAQVGRITEGQKNTAALIMYW